MNLNGTYTVAGWEEVPYRPDENGMRFSRITAQFLFAGDIVATGHVEYLMFYSSFDPADMHKSAAQYVGQIRLVGQVKGKSGSFVLNDSGTFHAGVANSEVDIIVGSGTGELSTLIGLGSYLADKDGCRWELDIQL